MTAVAAQQSYRYCCHQVKGTALAVQCIAREPPVHIAVFCSALRLAVTRAAGCCRLQKESNAGEIDWSAVDFSKSTQRGTLKRQRWWSALVCSKLSTPIMLAIVYFGAMYLLGVATVDTIHVDALTTFKIEMRKV